MFSEEVVIYVLTGTASFILFLFFLERYFRKRLANTSLKNKHVVITGGSSGIGKSLAMEAVKRGANVTIIARDETKLSKTKQELLQHCLCSTQRIFTLSLDISGAYEEIEKAVFLIEQECGPVYMLINCAGRAICGKLEDLSHADIRNLCELNYLGSILMTKAVIEGMKSRGEGHIVFTSSAAGLIGIYGLSAYSGSKFALRGLAESLQMEVQCYGLNVTIAYPPDTDTPGFSLEEKGKPKETKLICQSGGLYQPSVVANKILQDSLEGKFSSYLGFEGFMVATLNAGMSPANSFLQLLLEAILIGVFRIVGACYLLYFRRIIQKCMADKNRSKKPE